jgi:hypothetical protein
MSGLNNEFDADIQKEQPPSKGLAMKQTFLVFMSFVVLMIMSGCDVPTNGAKLPFEDPPATCGNPSESTPCVSRCVPDEGGGITWDLMHCVKQQDGCYRPMVTECANGCGQSPDGDSCNSAPLVAAYSTKAGTIRWCVYDVLQRPFCPVTLYDKGDNPYDGWIECSNQEALNSTSAFPWCPNGLGYFEWGLQVTFCRDLQAASCPCDGYKISSPYSNATGDCVFTNPIVTACRVSAWDSWSTCTDKCGGGEQTRERLIAAQPSDGGAPCPPLSETRACNTDPCPADSGVDAKDAGTPGVAEASVDSSEQ